MEGQGIWREIERHRDRAGGRQENLGEPAVGVTRNCHSVIEAGRVHLESLGGTAVRKAFASHASTKLAKRWVLAAAGICAVV
jgi:hypothetical protein